MRHRAHGRKLGRTSSHRQAMFRNQLTQLFTHERIITTVAKAKDLRPQAEKMVTLARTGSLANRRRILQSISDADVVRKLFDEIAPRFADRPGGYDPAIQTFLLIPVGATLLLGLLRPPAPPPTQGEIDP